LTTAIVVIHFIDCMHQFKMLNRFLYTSEIVFAAARRRFDGSDWIGSVSLWIGLDWI